MKEQPGLPDQNIGHAFASEPPLLFFLGIPVLLCVKRCKEATANKVENFSFCNTHTWNRVTR